MHAMVRTTILIVVGQLRSDQWDVMNLDGRIMSQQSGGGLDGQIWTGEIS